MNKSNFSWRLTFQLLLGVVSVGGMGVTASDAQVLRERTGSGNLPPVDIQNVSRDAMKEGVFRLKFSPEAIQWMEEHHAERSANVSSGLFSLGPDGFLETGIAAFDSLSKAHSLVEAISILDMLVEASPTSLQYRNRHTEWGFHLWYEFKTTMKADIVDVLPEYTRIPDILIAEPVYKIISIGPVTKDTSDSQDSPISISQSSWTPNDPEYASKQWHFNNTGQLIGSSEGLAGADISMPEAWGITKGNPAVIVAVIDGGVQTDHPDIAANMWPGIGYNFVDGNSTITPDIHGTHVAGTIAAVSNNGTGVAGIAGGDGSGNGVQIMTCQIFKSGTSGGVAQAMIYAADNGAAISQNSWGYEDSLTYSQLHLDAIDYFNVNGGGGVMEGGISIFAAGNSNSQQAWYPAYYEGAFAVASTNNLDKRSGFSNYGAWIDVSAPGSIVYSTNASSSYGTMSGTSMACPHVSGVAALILSLAPGQFTAEEVKSIIKNSTDDHYIHNPDYIGLLGSGRLNAHAALEEAISLLGGVKNPYAFEAVASGTSQIMLTWHKNEENEPVMIAWSPDGVFGTPENGTSYAAGQAISGGGTVLYKGINTTYSHSGLSPNTHYYYRAWSTNPDGEYSIGANASARTDCLALTLPLTETFSGGQVPPECWSLLDNDGDGKSWFVGSQGDYTPQTGSYVAVSESYLNEHGPLTPDNWLISPHFSSSTEYVKVTYWVKAQDQDWAEETYSVMVSTSGKQPADFIELFNETLSDGEWHERVLHIPDMAGKLVFVAFRHYGSTDQYQILIDNIHIEESSPPATFTITSTSGSGGNISPSGSVIVNEGDNQGFSIIPETGYLIADVIVDGIAIGPQTSYMFNDVQADHTIAAVFEPITYFISASAGPGGSISPSGSVLVSYGQSQSFSINSNPGYEIDDVIVNGESLGRQTSYTFSNVQSNHTIHVVFEPNFYSIYASTGFGGSITPSGSVMVTYGQDQTFSILPDNGFVIYNIFVDGISIDPVSSYSFSYVQSDHSIHASFAAKTYTIDAYAGAGGSITPSGSVSVNHGHNQTFNITPDQDFHISHVIVDGLNIGPQSSYRFTFVSSDHSIEAFFAINTYTIMATAGAGGTISPSGELVVAHGDSQAYSITADAGYHIADVVVDGVSQGAVDTWVFEGVSTDHQIDATFAINTYTITASAGAGGTISPTGKLVLDHGASQMYAITEDEGYHIADVLVDGVSQGPVGEWVFEAVNRDHQIDASFAINTYTITATAGAGGTISPTGELVVVHGDSQAYAITADAGYHLADVIVDGVSQGAVDGWVFEGVSTNHQIDARFAINTYTITATAGAGGTISPTGELVVVHGDSQAYAITADAGYHLADVIVDGVSQGAVDGWVFEGVSTNHQIDAIFAINTYTITATAGAGGTISPTGELVVEHGDSQAYAITADTGYHIADVVVDKVSQGAIDTWVFEVISTDHAIHVVFERLYVVIFYVDMQYAKDFSPDRDNLFLFGSMFDWNGDGGLIEEKASLPGENHEVYEYKTELPAGSYEYLYYLNTYPAGAEWTEAPNRTFTVPDTLELFDFFGYRTDPTSLPNTTDRGKLTVYPNPVRNNMTIESNLTINSFQVYDINGRLIHYTEPGLRRFDINIAGWPDGVYFIRAVADGSIITGTVVVKN